MLYPIQNDRRNRLDLSGIWDFQSWNEQVADLYNYFGMGWYLRKASIPHGWRGQRVFIRVGSANYFARVWVNGIAVGEHNGGHLPFAFDITDHLLWDSPNTLAIQVENHLMPTRVPAGNVAGALAGLNSGYPSTTFDIFNDYLFKIASRYGEIVYENIITSSCQVLVDR